MAKKSPSTRGRGRPTLYGKALATTVCERMADGEPIHHICDSAGMPCWKTIQHWLVRHKEFRAAYVSARAIHADYEFERLRAIEDKVLDGNLDANAARVVLKSINWRLGRMKPKVYGDYRTQDINVSGSLHVKRVTLVDEADQPKQDRNKKK